MTMTSAHPELGKATRVALITPPLESSGGIGRLMSYVLALMPAENITITLLDPRGSSLRPVLSLFPLARAWMELVLLGLTRSVDVAHINLSSHGSSIRKPILLWTCRLFRIPVVLHLHASQYPAFFDPLPRPAKALLRRTFANADLVVVLGLKWRDYVCRELGVLPHKVTVLLNGAPGPDATRSPGTGTSHPFKILFLGRLGARKGVPEILHALADPRLCALPWLATFAGDGDIGLYRTEATRLRLDDRVIFSGWVSAHDAQQLLLTSDLLLLPSHAEGLPMCVIEAFACGVPVVSTPVGAITDILADGVNGVLVDAGDSAHLADAILSLIQDEQLRLALAQNARRTWEDGLDIARYVPALAACWRRVSVGAEPAQPIG
jgi:glycosyltransferase involved in cell wall biosynthesis